MSVPNKKMIYAEFQSREMYLRGKSHSLSFQYFLSLLKTHQHPE